jgi:hypothetical protein
LAEVEGLVPSGTDVLLCEGLMTGGPDVRTVVCLRDAGQARFHLSELPEGANPVAVSGLVAAAGGELGDLPVLDVTVDEDLGRLVDLALG